MSKSGKQKREALRKERLAKESEGSFWYQNISTADALLHKPLSTGKKLVRPSEKFIGDGSYRKMCPLPLRMICPVDPMPPALEAEEVVEEQLNGIGEDVELAKEACEQKSVEVKEVTKEDRPELTEELCRQLRVEEGLSWAKFARHTGYSITYVRKQCKKFNIS